ncbi:hypothetical protein UFOVP181_160 [uncultured Caudovirales phage]|uniref:Uncharacterized protein n=1 Tax=uncultured Caudovirales phage TaxID=2100421 RepID=A0A6J7WGY8_9CAUD|nr:hypothetical protein UFOVP57_2 [uncultured Caudovirales phage]CAB5208771.1 hypothetical protein UFOVP181_160 [uncultured Caudovirales phage]
MAAKGKKVSSMLTRNGKTRLGPLNVAQLEKLLESNSKPKEKAKIRRALAQRRKTQQVSAKVVAVEVTEEVVVESAE